MHETQIENKVEVNSPDLIWEDSTMVKVQQQQSTVSIPALIVMLLIIFYGELSGALYLAQEIDDCVFRLIGPS